MKKLLVLSFICAAGIIACGKKIMPESDANNQSNPATGKTAGAASQQATPNTSATTPPSFNDMKASKTAIPTALDPAYLEQGKAVYLSKCGTCHTFKKISDYTSYQWTNILKTEIPRAKLSNVEGGQVKAFILAKANK